MNSGAMCNVVDCDEFWCNVQELQLQFQLQLLVVPFYSKFSALLKWPKHVANGKVPVRGSETFKGMYSGVEIYPDIAAERQTLILQLFLNFATFLLHAQTIKAKTGNNKQPLTTLVIICSLQHQSRKGPYSQVATSFQQWMDWDAKLLVLWRS